MQLAETQLSRNLRCMNVHDVCRVHLVGIGGINMSAVAKLLLAAKVRVSGSDAAENEQTELLRERGVDIRIGSAAENVPSDAEILVYSSAVPMNDPERKEARRLEIPEWTNFQFLGEYFKNEKTVVVCGTHGKSTTTAMLSLVARAADLDATVIVGSKVPQFPEGNLMLSSQRSVVGSRLFIVEGDEYERHFLYFHPDAVLLNNIELDHVDVFPDLASVVAAFRELILKITYGGILVANVGDTNVRKLLTQEAEALELLKLRIVYFNSDGEDTWKVLEEFNAGITHVTIEKPGMTMRFDLNVAGAFNAVNATGAALMARELGADWPTIAVGLVSFTGIWRRMELLRDKDDIRIYSDYGHHPTAVTATLVAAKEMSMGSRIILCFQPHHRNRIKHLFFEFVTSFDLADSLVLCEIYDVAGRDAHEDKTISSKDLTDAIIRHDADRGVTRVVDYASDPVSAVKRTLKMAEPGDIVIIMGAGDIDEALRKII